MEWTEADGVAARQEGWDLNGKFKVRAVFGYSHGPCFIGEREGADPAALAWVQANAELGSPFHQKALTLAGITT